MPRVSLRAVVVLFANVCCYDPDVRSAAPCSGDDCTSSGGVEPTGSSGPVDPTTVGTTDAPMTTAAPAESSDGSSGVDPGVSSEGSSSDDGPGDSSSTGEPTDNMYAPCSSDEECTSGYCGGGFCTQICWTQVDGETPCPPPPAGAVGLTIECGRIDFPSRPGVLCEGCFDCGQYCVAVCDGGSTCPNGSSCLADPCGGADDYCG